MSIKDQFEAYETLRTAAEEFVGRVERGEVRSQRTYRTMKAALEKLPPRVPVLTPCSEEVPSRVNIKEANARMMCGARPSISPWVRLGVLPPGDKR